MKHNGDETIFDFDGLQYIRHQYPHTVSFNAFNRIITRLHLMTTIERKRCIGPFRIVQLHLHY